MSDYIKREDAIASIMAHDLVEDGDGSREWAEHLLENATIADVVKARHGRWIKHSKGLKAVDRNGNIIAFKADYECLNCGARTFEMPYNYCPTCGAKMLNGLNTGAWEDIEDGDIDE